MMPIITLLFLTVAIQFKHSELTVADFPMVIFLMFMQSLNIIPSPPPLLLARG